MDGIHGEVADPAVAAHRDLARPRHLAQFRQPILLEHDPHADRSAGVNDRDGGHEHPTQTLCDLYTLRREKGKLKDLNVLLWGDLKNGRTVHSLVYGLARFGARISLDGEPAAVAAWYSAAYGHAEWQIVDSSHAGTTFELSVRKGRSESKVTVEREAEGRSLATVVVGVGAQILRTQ